MRSFVSHRGTAVLRAGFSATPGMMHGSRPAPPVSIWRAARYPLAAAAGALVLVSAFLVQQRPSFEVDDEFTETARVDLRFAMLPANQLSSALLDGNWLKVERYLAPDTADRDYLENFKLHPTVQALTNSDCRASDIKEVSVAPPPAQSTVFDVVVFMKRPCVSDAGTAFTAVRFSLAPRGSEWYYLSGTLGLQ